MYRKPSYRRRRRFKRCKSGARAAIRSGFGAAKMLWKTGKMFVGATRAAYKATRREQQIARIGIAGARRLIGILRRRGF